MSQVRWLLVAWLEGLLVGLPVMTQCESTGHFSPAFQPSLVAVEAHSRIKIDGDLNDPDWCLAAKATGFTERYPGDRTEPPVETVVYLTYDSDNLYVAFVCHDDLEAIRTSYCERDKIFSDDNVKVCLDPYGDAAWAYLLYANPYGVQGDAMWAATGSEDTGFDLIWESAGLVTDSGYQVEMAIPFSSLRFPNADTQVWRLDFWRIHPREMQAEYAWAAYDRDENCLPCQWGTVSGIAGVSPGRGVEITPSLIAYQSGRLAETGDVQSPYEYVSDAPDGELSLWAKYSVSSSATVEATVNPDFSQIEADVGQIDVNTTFTLFYPEKRPFFQEGNDLFRAAIPTVHTRMIQDPEAAAKLTVRSGRSRLGYLLARDRTSPIILPSGQRSDYLLAGQSISNVLRIRQSFGEGSEVGLILTDQRFDGGGSGSSLTSDGIIRLGRTVRGRYHLSVSQVTEHNDTVLSRMIVDPDSTFYMGYTRAMDGESFWGYFGNANLTWWTSTWNASIAVEHSTPTFRQYLGFVPENGYSAVSSVVGYFHRLTGGFFETINPHVRVFGQWDPDGKNQAKRLESNLWTRLRVAQGSFYTQYVRAAETFKKTQYDEIWYIYQDATLSLGDPVQFSVGFTYGPRIARRYSTLARILDLNLSLDVKPHDRFLMQQWLDYAHATAVEGGARLYDGFIWRTRLNYQVSRPIALRMVVEYDDFEMRWRLEPLITYSLNPFSVLYGGMASNYQRMACGGLDETRSFSTRLESRQFFLKLQYLFQL